MNNKNPLQQELITAYMSSLQELGKHQRVLVVEDDEEANRMLTLFLRKIYGKVDSVSDGLYALTMYKKYNYDIILSDIRMPNMDGIRLCKEIKRISPHQKIILITAFDEKETLLEALKLGVSDYLFKPLDFNLLIEPLYKISQQLSEEFIFDLYNNLDSNTKDENLKILLIDDSQVSRDAIRSIVEKNLYNPLIFEADNGATAIDILEKNKDIKMIFVDWHMPIFNGYDFVQAVRANPEYDDVKLIMATSEINKAKATDAFKLGLNGYIPKPFNPVLIAKTIKKFFG